MDAGGQLGDRLDRYDLFLNRGLGYVMPLIHGEPSFHLATPELDLDITIRGGQVAPVVFHLLGGDVSPYSLSPWEPDEFPELPPLLSVLRGDFFCLPFGEQEDGPPHGDPANAEWSLIEKKDCSLKLKLETSDSGASIEKIISIRPEQHSMFIEHRISNLEGNFNYGTHPILDLSSLPEGAGRVTTSPFHWASVFPGAFANTAEGETQSLVGGATFTDLRKVALATGGTADLTRYPQREGNEDLVMMANVPATPEQPFAWSAVILDSYLWFSLKNPADFPATLLWMSNRGRTAAPWNNRHIGRIGIEEVCSYFCHGVETSRKDLLSAQGIPTTRHFTSGETVSLRTIQAVASIPKDFGAVGKISPADEHTVSVIDEHGQDILVPVDWTFVI